MSKKLHVVVFLLFVFVSCFIIAYLNREKIIKPVEVEETPVVDVVEKEPISLCYYYSDKTEQGFYDRSWVRLDLSGDGGSIASGEFNYLPAEKDSKTGTFEGVALPLDKQTMSRTANVWWNSFGEGMQVKEELIVDFGEGNAAVAYGEMVDRGDGVYVYKDKTKLTYGPSLGQISCEDIDEMLAVEKYVKENIKTIATNKPVLGGSWHVVSVIANTFIHSGEVTYEDGHIQSKATFEYTFDASTKKTTIQKFVVKP